MTAAPPQHSGCTGFTLLELIIAIALLALLTAVLLAGFQFATRGFEHRSARLDRAASLPVICDFLRSQLAGARPIAPVNTGLGAIAFDGRASELDFVGAAPQSAPSGGLYLYSLEFAAGTLRLSWRRFDGVLPAANEESGDTVLLGNLRRAEFQYYGSPSFNSAFAWHNEWRTRPYLPLLVRLDLLFDDGEEAPPLVVAPRLRPLRTIPIAAPPLNETTP